MVANRASWDASRPIGTGAGSAVSGATTMGWPLTAKSILLRWSRFSFDSELEAQA
jgi:hypothetical protein